VNQLEKLEKVLDDDEKKPVLGENKMIFPHILNKLKDYLNIIDESDLETALLKNENLQKLGTINLQKNIIRLNEVKN
jgi:hypothetical protein